MLILGRYGRRSVETVSLGILTKKKVNFQKHFFVFFCCKMYKTNERTRRLINNQIKTVDIEVTELKKQNIFLSCDLYLITCCSSDNVSPFSTIIIKSWFALSSRLYLWAADLPGILFVSQLRACVLSRHDDAHESWSHLHCVKYQVLHSDGPKSFIWDDVVTVMRRFRWVNNCFIGTKCFYELKEGKEGSPLGPPFVKYSFIKRTIDHK